MIGRARSAPERSPSSLRRSFWSLLSSPGDRAAPGMSRVIPARAERWAQPHPTRPRRRPTVLLQAIPRDRRTDANAWRRRRSRIDRFLDLPPRQRQIAQPFSGGVGNGVRDRCGRRPLPVSPLPRKGFPGRLMTCTATLSGAALKRRISGKSANRCFEVFRTNSRSMLVAGGPASGTNVTVMQHTRTFFRRSASVRKS
jgi:hypothetical protein